MVVFFVEGMLCSYFVVRRSMLFSVLVYVCRLGGPSKIFFNKTNDDDDDDDDSVIVVEMQQPIS